MHFIQFPAVAWKDGHVAQMIYKAKIILIHYYISHDSKVSVMHLQAWPKHIT